MPSPSTLERFLKYSAALTDSCKSRPEIIGLIFLGSAAETSRVDEWSDHDFFVITNSGQQEKLRTDLTWLPEFESIAFSFRETEHGLKVVYKSGAVLEFAIFDCEELEACKVNHHALAFGTPEVEAALSTAAARLLEPVEVDPFSDFRLFLSLLVIAVGRARRGEILMAGFGIRRGALNAILRVFTFHLEPDVRLDQLDNARRFEFVYPAIGARLGRAVAQEPEPAAREMLRIAEEYLPSLWDDYPTENVEVVRHVLNWNE